MDKFVNNRYLSASEVLLHLYRGTYAVFLPEYLGSRTTV